MELIDKQTAIDTILGQPPEPHYPSWYAEQIKQLSPAQSEIIYCKNCKYSEYHKLYGDRFCQYDNVVHVVPDLHYCGYAERRIDE